MQSLLAMLAAVFILASVAEATLSPYYQSATEIQAVFKHPEVAAKLNPHTVIGIAKNSQTYTIATTGCTLAIEVQYLPSPEVGPAEFELVVGEAICGH